VFILLTSALERFVPALKKVAEATESTILVLLGSKRRLVSATIFAAALGAVAGIGEEVRSDEERLAGAERYQHTVHHKGWLKRSESNITHSTITYNLLLVASLLARLSRSPQLLFRGCIQQGLGMAVPEIVSVVLTSVIFALGHAVTPLYALISFIASMYFGWVYLYTGDLLIPIISHSLYDMIAVVATHWFVTGKSRKERDALRVITK